MEIDEKCVAILRVLREEDAKDGLLALEITERVNRHVSTIYTQLHRLEKLGLVKSWFMTEDPYAAPSPQGRRRLYAITDDGRREPTAIPAPGKH